MTTTSPRPIEPTTDSASPTIPSRRQAFRLAGAATAAAVVGSVAAARPAAAADPNDVVKESSNLVTKTTTLSGPVNNTPLLSLYNQGNLGTGLNVVSDSTPPAIHGQNLSTGTAVRATSYENGLDLEASGSGRIRLRSHRFGSAPSYLAGELHQSSGTLFAMVTPTSRRVVAGPATAGAFHLIAPVRVFDSRRKVPSPGKLTSGTSRVVSVADSRDGSTGQVVDADVVPAGATGVFFNLTITDTSSSGFLSIAPASVPTTSSSIINWSAAKSVAANSSVVGLDDSRRVRVFCGAGSTHFLLDVVGYFL